MTNKLTESLKKKYHNKFRIVEITRHSGENLYVPQQKLSLWWVGFTWHKADRLKGMGYEIYKGEAAFYTLDAAKAMINRDIGELEREEKRKRDKKIVKKQIILYP